MTEAWTPTTPDCADNGRSVTNLGGAAPYWTSYSYNNAGQRASETTHDTSGTTTTTYCYQEGGIQPHTLLATTTGACTGATAQYAYDTDGNTTKRPDGSTTQNLDRDSEGRLTRLTESPSSAARVTDYLYGADGNLLIRRNTAGETVLYLGTTEVHVKGGTAWANRYYTHGGETVAVRSNRSGATKITYLTGDQHDTNTVAITSDTHELTKRYLTPFGAERGSSAASWPDDKGFLGKTTDNDTGLTHVGAREYDAELGQFISADPLLQTNIPQTLNGYSYAAQNPVTQADPSGMGLADGKQGDMKIRLNGRELGSGVFLPVLVALACWGCGAADAAPSAGAGGQGGPRMYDGCADGRSLEQMQRVYGLVIPAAAKNLRYCDQESWSGSEGELQFDTSRKGIRSFLIESGPEDLNLVKGEPVDTEREWQEVRTGVSMESGTYVNRIGDCDNAVMLDIQDIRAEKVRVYIRVVCAS